jgi:hypothetical protein
MDLSRFSQFPESSSSPDQSRPSVVVAIGRRVWQAARAEALFLTLTTLAAAGPPAFIVAWFDGFNDKPGGSHVNAWTYPKVFLVAAVAAGLAALATRAFGRPRTFEAQVFRPVIFGGLAVAAVTLTSCFWLSCVFETRLP